MSVYASPPKPLARPDDPSGSDKQGHEPQLVNFNLFNDTKAFLDARHSLLDLISHSHSLLSSLNHFGQDTWLLAYPSLLPRHQSGPVRPDNSDNSGSSSNPLSVLCLENALNLPGRRVSSGTHCQVDSAVLLRQSTASMLCSRIEAVQSHLEDLRTRVLDRNSRILVTGDLNAGKSTFVNALLGCDVAPTDQQPCTEVMCEILDVSQNDSKEEIHAIPHGKSYQLVDSTSYDVFPIGKLPELVTNATMEADQPSPYQLLKVYISDPHLKTGDKSRRTDAISLLRNGDISVSFIDSPGLNRDTLSTMELFAKQSTIDVVVFVVSAENQFTLSAQEFLWAASQEKAYVFVVVNKWGAIRDKVKAERRIRDQLRKLSPGTWEERTELVHFVDSRQATLNAPSESGDSDDSPSAAELESFDHLQRSLSSFVFLRRSISKLQPAQTYTRNLLQDLTLIAQANLEAAQQLYGEATTRLENVLPRFNLLSSKSAVVEANVDQIEEDSVTSVNKTGRKILTSALAQVRDGRVARCRPLQPNSPAPYFPVYEGLLSIFQYAEEVRKALLASLEDSVKYAEDSARASTVKAVDALRNNPETKNLLQEENLTERTFNPQAMFSRPRKFQLVNPSRGSVTRFTTSLGIAGFGDLVDFERLNCFSTSSKVDERQLASTSLVGSIGLGTLTLFGTGVTGGRAFVEALVRVSELLGSRGARKWTGAAVAVISVGFGLYLISDLPRAIPRNIGRKLEKELNRSVSDSESTTWVEYEVNRMMKETRKVVRLAGWDLRQRFKNALEEASSETDEAKKELEKAVEVENWLNEFESEVHQLLDKVDRVGKSF